MSSSVGSAAAQAVASAIAQPQIFPLIANWPLDHDLAVLNIVSDFGDGFELRANLNLAHTRADGMGGVTSYKGQNKFTLQLNTRDFAGDALILWAFYKHMLGNVIAFYFYAVPSERSTIDFTGADTTGRYLVRFLDPSLSRENFTTKLYNQTLSLLEVRA